MLKFKNQKKNQKRQKVLKKRKIRQIGLTEIILKEFQLLLTAKKLITGVKQVKLSILALENWLMILEIIQLVYAKKDLNTLNKIKNAEIIKHKRRTSKQKELLNLFNDLSDTILTDKTLMSSKDKNEKEKGKRKGK